jgi:spore coat polysaccharide biosynthesis predicted glycosyltransferase SpsG
VRRIVVTLGGGRQRALTIAIVRALRTVLPDVRIFVPTGFVHDEALLALADDAVELVHAPDGLTALLVAADVAVTGGGVTLYEAAAAALPVVALPVVAAQRPAVRAFVRAGLAVSVVADENVAVCAGRVARRVARLAADRPRRVSMSARGPAVVDGRGAQRVARALVALAEGHRG